MPSSAYLVVGRALLYGAHTNHDNVISASAHSEDTPDHPIARKQIAVAIPAN